MTSETEALMKKSTAAILQLNDALIKVVAIMQEIDRRDSKIMARLRQEYGLPHALAVLSTSIGDNAALIRMLFGSLTDNAQL